MREGRELMFVRETAGCFVEALPVLEVRPGAFPCSYETPVKSNNNHHHRHEDLSD